MKFGGEPNFERVPSADEAKRFKFHEVLYRLGFDEETIAKLERVRFNKSTEHLDLKPDLIPIINASVLHGYINETKANELFEELEASGGADNWVTIDVLIKVISILQKNNAELTVIKRPNSK